MMLLDTHAVIWLALEPHRLSRRSMDAIKQGVKEGLAISGQSLYEAAWLIARGRVIAHEPLQDFLLAMAIRFDVRPLTVEVAAAAAQLPPAFPSDPFDRIIAATAIVEGVPLITADERIRNSGAVRTIW